MFCNTLFAAALAVFSQMVLAEGIAPAREPVEKLNAALIEVMKHADRLGYQGRYKKLEPVIKDVFQFEAIAEVALGAHWKKLDEIGQRAFVATLTDLSVATYAAEFDAYSGQTFRFDGTEEVKPGRVIVRYAMLRPDDESVKFDYIVNQYGKKWQIINVIADGVSDLAIKKGQYKSVIEREGFESLLAKLKQKITDYGKKSK